MSFPIKAHCSPWGTSSFHFKYPRNTLLLEDSLWERVCSFVMGQRNKREFWSHGEDSLYRMTQKIDYHLKDYLLYLCSFFSLFVTLLYRNICNEFKKFYDIRLPQYFLELWHFITLWFKIYCQVCSPIYPQGSERHNIGMNQFGN